MKLVLESGIFLFWGPHLAASAPMACIGLWKILGRTGSVTFVVTSIVYKTVDEVHRNLSSSHINHSNKNNSSNTQIVAAIIVW